VGYERVAIERGLGFQNLLLFSKKKLLTKIFGNIKMKPFPFYDMKDPELSYNYILFNIFVQDPI
jgi:hypothetical protein